jgi:two-component system chemotaxis response regulator CheB
MIRVLIVDDSPTARQLLGEILSSDPELLVVGEAADGVEAVAEARKLRPDLITMDVRMPRMDGFEATKEIMIETPTPIVIVTSSVVVGNVETSMHALRAGALSVLSKPAGPGAPEFEVAAQELLANVKALAQVKLVRHWRPKPGKAPDARPNRARPRVVAIAASTGGPAALQRLVTQLPRDFPVPILVVQHITQGFAPGLADWLDKEGNLRVKMARAGDKMLPHAIYVAADNQHLGVDNQGQIVLESSAPIGGFRPSGTFLFQSVARAFGPATLAIILTGMGEDGVAGLHAVRQAGGTILAQDEKTAVIYGMPGAAVQAGVVDEVLPLDAIAVRMIELTDNG